MPKSFGLSNKYSSLHNTQLSCCNKYGGAMGNNLDKKTLSKHETADKKHAGEKFVRPAVQAQSAGSTGRSALHGAEIPHTSNARNLRGSGISAKKVETRGGYVFR
jgi:hypothetical protein